MTHQSPLHSHNRIKVSANLLAPSDGQRVYSQADGFISCNAMAPELLEHYIRSYIEQHHQPEIEFIWQGPDPLLLGIDYFLHVVELQQYYRPAGTVVINRLHTDATQMTEQWARFLAEHHFCVQINIDGPGARQVIPSEHDQARLAKAMQGAALLQDHQVVFSTLTEVNRFNAEYPLTLYRFLRDTIGSTQMHFVPVVTPIDSNAEMTEQGLSPDSVYPSQWGDFLCSIFDEWFVHDVGNVNLPYVAACVETWMGHSSPLCTLSPTCGNQLALGCDGAVYACQQHLSPEYKLGHIAQDTLAELQTTAQHRLFSLAKEAGLPQSCRQCEYLFACFGECPKRRLSNQANSDSGRNYLCRGWYQFFSHIDHQVSLIIKAMGYQVAKKIQPPACQMHG